MSPKKPLLSVCRLKGYIIRDLYLRPGGKVVSLSGVIVVVVRLVRIGGSALLSRLFVSLNFAPSSNLQIHGCFAASSSGGGLVFSAKSNTVIDNDETDDDYERTCN